MWVDGQEAPDTAARAHGCMRNCRQFSLARTLNMWGGEEGGGEQ